MKKLFLRLLNESESSIQLKQFVEKFHNEIEVTTKVIRSCKTKEQVLNAQQMFHLIETKWSKLFYEHKTLEMLYFSEEKRFYQEIAKVKSNIVNI